MLSTSVQDFNCILCDKEMSVMMTSCLDQRPHMDTVDDSIDDRGTISKLGVGWSPSIKQTWFGAINDSNGSSQERKISSLFEAEESLIILKTLHSITLEYESEKEGRGYSMLCNVDDILKKKPELKAGRFQTFFEKPTFECSNSMVTSLPFDFASKLRVGKTVHLPKEWKAAVKKRCSISKFKYHDSDSAMTK